MPNIKSIYLHTLENIKNLVLYLLFQLLKPKLMNMKTLLLSLLLLTVSLSAYCQDKIYKRDGSTLTVLVKEISDKNVKYKKYDNQAGPDYSIAKDDVEKIQYQNGSEDVFDGDGDNRRRPSIMDIREEMQQKMAQRRAAKPKSKLDVAANILSIAPLQISDNGIGVGVSYERTLDKGGIVSFYLPVYLTWSVNSDPNNYNYNTGGYNNSLVSSDPMFYAAPGIKIYPTSNKGKVKYAVGPSIVVASGQKTYYDNNGGYTYETKQSRFMMGVMVVNSLNINPTPKIYLGLELGLGGTYINQTAGAIQQAQGLEEFSFRIGYRF
jgi:hypothetical protein